MVCEVELQSDIEFPKHAIKREDKQYVLSYDVKDGPHRVCIVGPDGYLRHAYGGKPGSGDLQLHTPSHLAPTSGNHLIVADSDNWRIVLLNSALEFVRYIGVDLREPYRLFFDKQASRLYVAERTTGNIKVFYVPPYQTK